MNTIQTAAPSAADRVYAFVKDAIIRRSLTADRLLAEGQIAEAVGVSRTPVREALLRLEGEGLVRLLPKRGVLVIPVTADEVRDVVETRRLIELHALTKIAEHGMAARHLMAMRAEIVRMRSCVDAADPDAEGYVRADRAFHTEIVAAAGNAILTQVYASMRDRQLRMGVVNLLAGDGHPDIDRMIATLAEHEHILDALAAGDAGQATAAMTDHVAATERLLGQR